MLSWLGSAIAAILNAFPRVLMFGVADAADVVLVSSRLWMEMIVCFCGRRPSCLNDACV